MSTRPTIGRRHVLHAAAAIGATTWLGRLLAPWPLSRSGRQPDSIRLARLLTQTDSARAIGEEYLQSAPDEADPARLTSLVTACLVDDPRALRAATDDQLRQLLLGSTRHDFADGLTVTLDGWMLSRTEARLCALAALI